MPNLSVIIPTHKRPDTLKKCLEHIEAQENVEEIEVIVVNDVDDNATEKIVQSAECRVQSFKIPSCQQGKARNFGIQKATSPICLIIGDDIFLAPDACKKHIEAHKKNSRFEIPTFAKPACRQGRATVDRRDSRFQTAVLGFTTWDPNLQITPVMKWLEKSGWQFGYPKIKKYSHNFLPEKIQHKFTYTSHISIPTQLVLDHPFKEDITLYGWEDIEWGERLKEAGIKLYYESDAKAFHHHRINLDESLKRMETLGKSISNFKTSERYPPKWKIMIYKLQSLLPTMTGKHRKAFLMGMKN